MSTEQQTLRDRIAEVIRPQVFPTSQDNHVARWIADSLMPVIAAELDTRWEDGRRAGITQIADHFTEAHDVAAQGLDLIVPPDHMRKRANEWMRYLRWAGDHVRAYAQGTADLIPTAADNLRSRQERETLLLQTRVAELEEERTGLRALLAEVQKILRRWGNPYVGGAGKFTHAVSEIRNVLGMSADDYDTVTATTAPTPTDHDE